MGHLWNDFRHGLRGLLRNPAFTIVTVLTLALGIGATTGAFSALNAVLLSSLPYPEPGRLVFGVSAFGGRNTGLSAHDFFDYRDQVKSFESFGGHLQYTRELVVTGGERPERVNATFVSTNFFTALGVTPAMGRTFTADEGKPAPIPAPNANPTIPEVAVISNTFWQHRLGGKPEVVGSSISLAGQTVTIVGVMPAGYRFMMDADVWLPMRLNGAAASARRFHNWIAIGRLKPSVTMAQAQAEVNGIAKSLERLYPESNKDMGLELSDLHERLVRNVRPQVLLIMGAVVLMLIIATTNVASLLLARGLNRRSEIAMRVALGASRGRIISQLVTESLTLALLGGVLGFGFALSLQRVLPSLLNLDTGRLGIHALPLDMSVLGFSFAVSILTGIAMGLMPALRASKISLVEELKSATRTITSRGGARLRLGLVGFQVALSLVLLVGSALLIRSFSKLVRVDLGFDHTNVVTSFLSLPPATANDAAFRFFDEVQTSMRAVPGVGAVGLVNRLPIVQGGGSTEVWNPDRPKDRSFSQQALGRVVLPGYFFAMRMPLIAGRDVQDSDGESSPPVAVISQTMARKLFSEAGVLGKKFAVDIGADQPAQLEIIGVVADARLNQMDDDPDMVMYLPFKQYPNSSMRLAIRTNVDQAGVTRALREIVWQKNKDIPVEEVATLTGAINQSTRVQQTLASTVTGFSLLALLLAAIGLYGVIAYQVSQRQHEIGIRLAIGARQRDILTAVLGQGLAVTGIGLVAGAVAGLALTTMMRGMLYAVAPSDPLSFLAAGGCLLGVSLIACIGPALRALRIAPVKALRYE